MTPSGVALRFVGVTKRYAGTPALEGFTLDIHHGETFGLVGENGAGKTTLIKTLLDFCECDAGNIEIFGFSHRLTGSRARLAFLPERFNPPFYLTGRDFLRYLCELHRVPYEEANAQRILLQLDLNESALDKTVRAYSKGMTQKLGLAACLLAQKDCYLFDEPTSGLDPKARALLKHELRKLRADGRTVFFTSHALADVSEICDRMAVLHGGKLRFAGTPEELVDRYGAPDLEQAFLSCISQPAPA